MEAVYRQNWSFWIYNWGQRWCLENLDSLGELWEIPVGPRHQLLKKVLGHPQVVRLFPSGHVAVSGNTVVVTQRRGAADIW